MKLFKIEGGSAVANPEDAHPKLFGLEDAQNDIPLLRSEDGGATWQRVGHYARNLRFGGFDSLPSWD